MLMFCKNQKYPRTAPLVLPVAWGWFNGCQVVASYLRGAHSAPQQTRETTDRTEHYTVSFSLCAHAGQGGFTSRVGLWAAVRHTSFHCTSQMMWLFSFLTNSGLRQPFIKQAYQCQFSNSIILYVGSPGGLDSKESACSAEDPGSTPGRGRSPGEGNGHPLQCSCLESPVDRGTWGAIVHGVTKSRTRLSD